MNLICFEILGVEMWTFVQFSAECLMCLHLLNEWMSLMSWLLRKYCEWISD
jgi:hypothetical protein